MADVSGVQLRHTIGGFYQLIGEVLDVKASGLTEASSPETVRGWDSLRSILLVTAAEQRYQVKLTLAEIMDIRTIGDVKAALGKHGVRFDA